MSEKLHSLWRSARKWLGPLVGAIVFSLVAIVAWRVVDQYRWVDIADALAALSPASIARAAVFAGASYLCLTFFDFIALRCVRRPLPWPIVALASFTSLSIGHNVGFAGLSSGTVRYRFYSRWGLSFEEIARLVIFCAITVAMGLTTVAGCALMFNSSLAASLTGWSATAAPVAGLLLLLVPATYVGLTRFRSSVSLLRWNIPLPSTALAAAQVLVGSLNYLSLGACLYQLVGGTGGVGYFDVAGAYVLANTGVIASHVPGGIGVLESIMLTLLPGVSVLAALLVFRVLYYLVPLMLGLALLGLSEVLLKPRKAWPAQTAPKPSLQKP